MMYGAWDGAMGAWGWIGIAFMALFWIGVFGLAIWGILSISRGTRRRESASPGAILDWRLARGEIDESEYERLDATLRAPVSTGAK